MKRFKKPKKPVETKEPEGKESKNGEIDHAENDLSDLNESQRAIFENNRDQILWLISYAIVLLDTGSCDYIQMIMNSIEELKVRLNTVFEVDYVFPYHSGVQFSGFLEKLKI